jgi:hypothetical protein
MRAVSFLIPLLIAALFQISCEKDPDPNNNNNNNNSDTTELSLPWTVPADTNILPIAANHQSDIMKVFNVSGKEYHYYHIFTGAQHQYYICNFENNEWSNCAYSPNQFIVNASDDKICRVEISSVNSQQTVILTRFMPGSTGTWGAGIPQTLPFNANILVLAATETDFYLAVKSTNLQPANLYKWNVSTQEWDLLISNIPESEDWNTTGFEFLRGKSGEFVAKITNSFGVNFYVFKNGAFERIYRGPAEIIPGRAANIHVVNNDYILALDKIFRLGASNSLEALYSAPENFTILQSSASGNKIIMSMGTYSWNGTTSVQKYAVYDVVSRKVYNLSEMVNYYNHDWRMSDKYDVHKWHFRINSDNRVEGVLNFEYGGFGFSKTYRVLYPTALD